MRRSHLFAVPIMLATGDNRMLLWPRHVALKKRSSRARRSDNGLSTVQ